MANYTSSFRYFFTKEDRNLITYLRDLLNVSLETDGMFDSDFDVVSALLTTVYENVKKDN